MNPFENHNLGAPERTDFVRAQQWLKASPQDRKRALRSGTAVGYMEATIRVLLDVVGKNAGAAKRNGAAAQAKVRTEVAKAVSEEPDPPVTLAMVAAATGKHFRVPVRTLRGDSRLPVVVSARAVAVLVARSLSARQPSYTRLGQFFGWRDHATMLHAHRKALSSPELRERAQEVAELLGVASALRRHLEEEDGRVSGLTEGAA